MLFGPECKHITLSVFRRARSSKTYKAHDSNLWYIAFHYKVQWKSQNRIREVKYIYRHTGAVKLDYVINQNTACQWLMTDFLSVFACVFWVAPGGVALSMVLTFWFIQRVRVGPQDVHTQWQNVFLILNGLCLLYTEKWQNPSTHRWRLIHWHTLTHIIGGWTPLRW